MASAQELKAQGAVEAAQEGAVSPEQAGKAIMNQAREGGAAAFEFDADMSPEEKAAAAREVGFQYLHMCERTSPGSSGNTTRFTQADAFV